MPVPTAWLQLIGKYAEAERAAGRAGTTIATRRSHLGRLARELRAAPSEVDEKLLIGFFGRQTWAVETRRSWGNTVASFFKWAHRAGHVAVDPAAELESVAPSHPAPRPAPDAAWSAALEAADGRVTLMLRLAAEAGLRRAEVAQVTVGDLTVGPYGAQLLVHGKGSKLRTVPIADDLAALIAAGAEGHTPEEAAFGPAGYLFPGDDDGHLSPEWVGRLCADALPGGWTMHTLRHRFATRAYRGTRNIRAVQTLLGHSSVATTERYTAVDDAEIRAAMMAAR
ncbi:tyrosine-type recombinase/integrase [Mycobacterium hodleri]|uniref:tyrosine-type recombinase/integrase n=1 Tax=Mycolicibacterium hodleri TaxID=49897 RepID=UPI0021F27AE4|nr:tyrosine-type recombinase/integrase [Mycolicibacterium hodleri]MCV7134408.1 tyrosine-type recombinase/integrase [Mycolicibacterium hodleri]